LGEALKWEASRGGALFPHLYRPLLPSEVAARKDLELDADGIPQLGVLSRMSLHDIAARALHAFDPEDAHGWRSRA
jgi:hypothetical protein